jgi:uncharacterized membrane protein YdjX (TVP38/TMEM64 family)
MAVLFGATTAWIVSRTGGSEWVRKARAEQGTLIASGMMAGVAIFGILTAVLRLPDLGAPIRYIAVGVKYDLIEGKLEEIVASPYFEHYGQLISLIALVGLALTSFFLARWGASGTIQEEGESPQES